MERPNILFIQSDQHRHDGLGSAGRCPVLTPHLDALAQEGVRFTDAYTPIPICCPARQALINGRRPEAFGALWNFDNSFSVQHLSPEDYSWPRELKESGYQTGYVGKWHVHPERGPEAFGFEQCRLDTEYRKFRREKYPLHKFEHGFAGEVDPIPLEDTFTHWAARKAEELLRSFTAAGRPWHLRLDFHEPHPPYRPARAFDEMYSAADIPKWGSFDDTFAGKPYIQKQQLLSWGIEQYGWEEWAPIVARYYAAISQMDDAIGRVLSVLDELGMKENTIVVYTSDHGDMCGSHRMMDKHYIMYDDVVRVPLIVRWPKRLATGTVCDRFVYSALDLPPTLLEACGLAAQPFFHGSSLLPLLDGTAPDDWRTAVVSTYNGQQFGLYTQRMIRTADYKYIWNLTDVDEFYVMGDDPHELHNAIDRPQYQETIRELRKSLCAELEAVGDRSVNQFTRRQLLDGRIS
jgi:arylsulfatase A-like enzyme